MELASIWDRLTKGKVETQAVRPANLSEALSSFKSGGPPPPSQYDQSQHWDEMRRLMAPYAKNLVADCAQTYLDYVEKTGCTTCLNEDVARKMREILWAAWRRADIPKKKKFERCNRLPDLTPYFVEVVRYLNAGQSAQNHVAYYCVEKKQTNNVLWFIAPKVQSLRNPELVKKNSGSEITATLY